MRRLDGQYRRSPPRLCCGAFFFFFYTRHAAHLTECRRSKADISSQRTFCFDPKRTIPITASDLLWCNYRWHRAGLGDSYMRRRDFIKAIVGSVVTSPLLAQAQQNGRLRRIAALMPFTATDAQAQARNAAFLQGLQQLGWSVGRNVQIDYRWSGGISTTRANTHQNW